MADNFASKADYELCRNIHKEFGTTYYFASRFFPKHIQQRVDAVYAFVRIPDEWVDNPQGKSIAEQRELIESWRAQFHQGLQGVCPKHPAMKAFVDTVRETKIPPAEADAFLDAMDADTHKTRYETYDDLRHYMRGSASAVGVMMCYAMDAMPDDFTFARAYALGEAMQLTNFLRDVAEDADRGRIYLPQEDLAEFKIPEYQILGKRFSPEFKELMRHQICRAKLLYLHSDLGLARLPSRAQSAVMLARFLYAGILDVIEDQNHNVFAQRARTSRATKIRVAKEVLLKKNQLIKQMTAVPYS